MSSFLLLIMVILFVVIEFFIFKVLDSISASLRDLYSLYFEKLGNKNEFDLDFKER